MSTSAEPIFSLIVATYGRADVLQPLVQSLLSQTCQRFEVIVADQNPDDRVLPLIAPLRSAGRLGTHIRLPEPNLSAARNAGIAVARGDIVAFPDDDCWYEPETIARAARHLGAAGGLDGLAARWVEAAVEPGDLATEPITAAAMRRFRGGNVASITLFLKRAAIEAVGGFDERIGVGRWYGAAEETDLVMALVTRGYRIAHARDVCVHHAYEGANTEALPIDRERARARGTGALYAKHRLPAWVILRGLLAPLLAMPGPDLAAGAARALGRLEGMVRWNLVESEPRISKKKPGQGRKPTM